MKSLCLMHNALILWPYDDSFMNSFPPIFYYAIFFNRGFQRRLHVCIYGSIKPILALLLLLLLVLHFGGTFKLASIDEATS